MFCFVLNKLFFLIYSRTRNLVFIFTKLFFVLCLVLHQLKLNSCSTEAFASVTTSNQLSAGQKIVTNMKVNENVRSRSSLLLSIFHQFAYHRPVNVPVYSRKHVALTSVTGTRIVSRNATSLCAR